MRKRIILVLLLAVLFLSLTVISAAADTLVSDGAGLFTKSERAALAERLAEASEKCGVLITVTTTEDYYYYTSGGYNTDLAALVIYKTQSGYEYALDTYGEAYDKISDAEADRILDSPEVYDNIKSGKIYTGTLGAVELIETAISGKLKVPYSTALIAGLVIALIVAAVVVICIVSSYKKKNRSPSYPLEKYTNMQLVASSDDFLGKSVTTVRIRRNRGSSGGRGGSFGGGGRRGRR